MASPTYDDVLAGVMAFQKHERRDAMYKTATFLVSHFWGKPSEMADGLGVLLLTWNQAFYRYGGFDFDILEQCIAHNIEVLESYRLRDIHSYDYSDNIEIKRLVGEFTDALCVRKEGRVGQKSPVGTSKALHLLAPAFFPLWDNEIAKAYRYSYQSKPIEKYLGFMREMKLILLTLNLNSLSVEMGKTALKLLDEYNYSKFTKGWI
jgi:hypothetical protein